MTASDFFGWMLGTLFAVLLIVVLSQGCKIKAENPTSTDGAPVVELMQPAYSCSTVTIEQSRFVVCRTSGGVAITPLETKCNPQ